MGKELPKRKLQKYKERVRDELQNNPYWRVHVLKKFWVCPYDGGLVPLRPDPDSMSDAIVTYLTTRCERWDEFRGQPISFQRLKLIAFQHEARQKLQNDPVWQIGDPDDGNWFCPFSARFTGIRVKDFGDIPDQKVQAIVDHVTQTKEFIENNGKPRALPYLKTKMLFLKDPAFRVTSARGRWISPYSMRETDIEADRDRYPIEDIWEQVWKHLQTDRAFDNGKGQPRSVDELQRNLQRSERVNRVARKVQDKFRKEKQWARFSDDGLWDCPFCGNGVSSIDAPSTNPVVLRKSSMNIAKHLLYACQPFQNQVRDVPTEEIDDELDRLPEPQEAIPAQAGGGGTPAHRHSTSISLSAANLQREAGYGADGADDHDDADGEAAIMQSGINFGEPTTAGPSSPMTPDMFLVNRDDDPFPVDALSSTSLASAPPSDPLPADAHTALRVDDDVASALPVTGNTGMLDDPDASQRPSFALLQNLSNSMTRIMEERSEQQQQADRAIEEARKKQQRMLPDPPEIDGMEIAVIYQPCELVGGDFYDFIKIGTQHLGIVQGDVSGHGLEVWGDMAMTMKTLRIYGRQSTSPKETLINANEDLVPDLMAKTFVSAFYTIIDIETFSVKMSRAGHNPLIIFNPDRTPQPLIMYEPKGMVLGMGKGDMFTRTIEEIDVQLYSGDMLLWYTDGVTETMSPDNEEWGLESLCKVIEQHGHRDASYLLDMIQQHIRNFSGGADPDDDITMISLKIH